MNRTIVTTEEGEWVLPARRRVPARVNRNSPGQRYRKGTIRPVAPRAPAGPAPVEDDFGWLDDLRAPVDDDPGQITYQEPEEEVYVVPDRLAEIRRLMGIAPGVYVEILGVEEFGCLEKIAYTVYNDPEIVLCWKNTGARLNEKLAKFQLMREDARWLAKDGRACWNEEILPQVILADLTRAELEYIKGWVLDIIDHLRTVPAHRQERSAIYQEFVRTPRWSRYGDHPLDILGVR